MFPSPLGVISFFTDAYDTVVDCEISGFRPLSGLSLFLLEHWKM